MFSVVVIYSHDTTATSILHLSLTEVREKADLIIISTVEDVNSRWNDSGKMIVTDYIIEVEEVLKGSIDDLTLVCSFAGGTVDENV